MRVAVSIFHLPPEPCGMTWHKLPQDCEIWFVLVFYLCGWYETSPPGILQAYTYVFYHFGPVNPAPVHFFYTSRIWCLVILVLIMSHLHLTDTCT